MFVNMRFCVRPVHGSEFVNEYFSYLAVECSEVYVHSVVPSYFWYCFQTVLDLLAGDGVVEELAVKSSPIEDGMAPGMYGRVLDLGTHYPVVGFFVGTDDRGRAIVFLYIVSIVVGDTNVVHNRFEPVVVVEICRGRFVIRCKWMG